MGFRILVTAPGLAAEARALLEDQECRVEVCESPCASEDLARVLAGFRPDGLIVRSGKITKAVMDATNTLRVVCKHGVGIDNIDVEAATARGIPVLITPFANSESVAEHSLALILALIRRIAIQDRRMRAGVFDKKAYDGVELRGKTLGLVGFGRSARRLCDLVEPFGTAVVVFHPSRTDERLPNHVRKVDEVREVFLTADIISLHCPLTPETRDLIDGTSIATMKHGVYLINTSRGGLVNERDLTAALLTGRVAAAALDVFVDEPPIGSPLLSLDNVILTPHIAGTSDVASTRMGIDAARNALAVLRGEPVDLTSLLNPGVYRPRTFGT